MKDLASWNDGPSGVIQLRSGAWRWSARSAAIGTALYYVGVERREEMSSWTQVLEITAEEAKRAGVDPAVRVWTDGVGLRWEVSLEPIRPWRRRPDEPIPTGGEYARLIFKRALYRSAVVVPASTHLGELTQRELLELHGQADRY